MSLVVYLDETGDHSLEAGDPGYPVFGLVMLICDSDIYCRRIVPAVYRLEYTYSIHTKSADPDDSSCPIRGS